VAEYVQPLLGSIEAPVVFEAAKSVLALARIPGSALAAAPTLAVGALVDLWDHDSTGVTHSQIMDALTANLSALQVSHPFPDGFMLAGRR
jgi:hypothetical protein